MTKKRDERGAKVVHWAGGAYQTVTRRRRKAKICVKCLQPIPKPVLDPGEDERCHRCADPE